MVWDTIKIHKLRQSFCRPFLCPSINKFAQQTTTDWVTGHEFKEVQFKVVHTLFLQNLYSFHMQNIHSIPTLSSQFISAKNSLSKTSHLNILNSQSSKSHHLNQVWVLSICSVSAGLIFSRTFFIAHVCQGDPYEPLDTRVFNRSFLGNCISVLVFCW